MRKLLKIDKISDMTKTINYIPLDKIEKINKIINDRLKD